MAFSDLHEMAVAVCCARRLAAPSPQACTGVFVRTGKTFWPYPSIAAGWFVNTRDLGFLYSRTRLDGPAIQLPQYVHYRNSALQNPARRGDCIGHLRPGHLVHPV